MKRILCCLALAAALPVPHAFASNVDFNIGINVGTRPTVVAPVPPPRRSTMSRLLSTRSHPSLSSHPNWASMWLSASPRTFFLWATVTFRYHNNVWYEAPYYGAPWVVTRYSALPWKLRRYPYKKIRYYRDAGYRNYRQGRDAYWERHQFRPKHEREA